MQKEDHAAHAGLLRDWIEQADDPRRKLALQRELIEALQESDPKQGGEIASDAILLASSLGDSHMLADLHYYLGRSRASLGIHDSTEFKDAYDLYLAQGRLRGAGAAAIAAGDADVASQQYRSGLAWYNVVLEIGTQSGEDAVIADALEHLGELYTTLGDYSKALDFHLRCLSICEERGDFSRVAHLFHAIGLVHAFDRNYDAAHDYLARSLEVFRETGDCYAEVKALKNLGDIHCARGEFEKALECGMRALTVYEALEDSTGMVSALLTIGTIHARQRQIDVALHVHMRALELIGESGDKGLHVTALLNIGRFYHETGDHQGARFVLEQGLAIAEAIDDRSTQYQIHDELARVLERLGDFRGALQHHRQFVRMLMKQTGEEKQKSIAEVQMRFDLERALKDEEIRQRNNVMQAVVETQELERRRIAGDLHDGVGQLLVTAKINLLRVEDGVKELNDDLQDTFSRAMGILDKACNDVRTLAHRMGSSTLQELGIGPALAEIVRTIQDSGSVRFTLDVHGVDDRLPEYLELGLYRIAQELISNILKHSHGTAATIQLVQLEKSVVLMVEDNGDGYDTSGRGHGGMGTKSIEARVKIMGGNVEFDSRPGHGTTVTVELPIEEEEREERPMEGPMEGHH
jgi:signal transduction histidine kinase